MHEQEVRMQQESPQVFETFPLRKGHQACGHLCEMENMMLAENPLENRTVRQIDGTT